MGRSEEDQLLDGWIAAVAVGDKEALARLYERMRTPVYGLALSIVREQGDAEDVTHNTFLKVWDCAGQYRTGTDPRAWILKIARNLALMLLRGRKKTVPVAEWWDEAEGRDDTGDILDRMLLNTLLTALDEGERQIVMLYAVEGYSHKEIAALLHKPYATVRWKYSNAIKKLSRRLEDAAGTARPGEAPEKKPRARQIAVL